MSSMAVSKNHTGHVQICELAETPGGGMSTYTVAPRLSADLLACLSRVLDELLARNGAQPEMALTETAGCNQGRACMHSLLAPMAILMMGA